MSTITLRSEMLRRGWSITNDDVFKWSTSRSYAHAFIRPSGCMSIIMASKDGGGSAMIEKDTPSVMAESATGLVS